MPPRWLKELLVFDSASTPRRMLSFDANIPSGFQPPGPSFAGRIGPRPGSKSPALSMREAVLVVVISIELIFLPWALGTMHAWSQIVSLGFSASALAVALSQPAAKPANRPLARLLRFPVFWCGILVLAYMAVQGLNPAWRFEMNSKSWWLVPVAHIAHLPSGVEAPFSRSNPWRAVVILSPVWLLVCSIWVGFHRRLSFRLLAGAIVLSGALLSLVGLFEQITGTARIYWEYQAPITSQFFATFIYRNHAGAYFNLVVAMATGMAAWHLRRSQRRIEGPGMAIAYGFAAALIGIAVIFSSSRMSFVVMITFTLVVAVAAGVSPASEAVGHRHRRVWKIILFPAMCIVAIGFVSFEATAVWQRIAALVANPTITLQSRTIARQAAEEMFRDHWVLGWGAGCFRYGFPIYQQNYPEIYNGQSGRFYWEHAHDDLLEFPLELGVLGTIPIVVALGYAAWRAARVRVLRNPFSMCVVTGCVLTLVHAWVDFVFQNPAVTATWAVLLVSAVRWAELESSIDRRRPSA